MAISLQKGQKIDLSKDGSQLVNIMVGLGWKEAKASGGFFSKLKAKQDVDIDASVLMLNGGGKVPSNDYLIYFGHKDYQNGCVHHCGDNLVGGTTGGMADSEQIMVDLSRIPSEIDRLVFVVNIYDCIKRKQHFGMVENAYIRIVDQSSKETIASYNLTEDYSGKTSIVVGEVYRHGGAWKFNAVGQAGYASGLGEIVQQYV